MTPVEALREWLDKVIASNPEGVGTVTLTIAHVKTIRAALAAHDAQAPEGWRLVPALPTDSMFSAWFKVGDPGCVTFAQRYAAMIAAAPAHDAQPQEAPPVAPDQRQRFEAWYRMSKYAEFSCDPHTEQTAWDAWRAAAPAQPAGGVPQPEGKR